MKGGRSGVAVALAALRTMRGWSQEELARAAGCKRSQVSLYEVGTSAPSPARLRRLVAALGADPADFDLFASLLGGFLADLEAGRRPQGLAGVTAAAGLLRPLTRLGAVLDAIVLEGTAEPRLLPSAAERAAAPALWARLAPLSPAERRRLVRQEKAFQSWALAELLCRESVAAAADSADRALELAELAVLVARLVPGEPAWRARLQGYAEAHLGNAWRVKTELPAADEVFRHAAELWQGGAGGDLEGLLPEAIVLGLEASLRYGQRQLAESLALLDRALALDDGSQRLRLLNKKARTLEELGRYLEAIETIEQALGLVDSDREPHLAWGLIFNLLVNLCHLNRHAEAEALLPEVRALAEQRSNDLDLVRLDWLEGRVAAGLGRLDEAEAAFQRVRQRFTKLEIPYDTALVTLDLAILLLDQGRTAEVAKLAAEMAWIFKSQKVARETLAALKLFCEAACREALTAEEAQRVLGEVRGGLTGSRPA